MFFRVQTAPGNQRQGRGPEKYQGKTLCVQRVYRSSPVRKPVLKWNIMADNSEEQLVDECRGQNFL